MVNMTETRRLLWIAGILLVGWLVYLLSPILLPFLAGALLAYLGNPLVTRLMRLGMKRPMAVSLVFGLIALVTILTLVLVLPVLWHQVLYLEDKLPMLLKWVQRNAIPWIERHFRVDVPRLNMDLVMSWVSSSIVGEEGATAKEVLSHVARSGLSLMALAGSLALVPVVTFYLMLDWEVLLARLREMIPRIYEPKVVTIVQECDDVLAAFLRGQLLVMIALGLIYAIGLSVVGLKTGLVIGLVAGLGSIIPYFGFTIGIVAATLAAFFQFQDWFHIGLVWAVFGVGQVLEGWLLTPYLVGDRIGLHPVAVIFAILAGGQLFGFFGMLVALPGAAIVMVFLRHARRRYLASSLYGGRLEDEV